MGMPAKMGMPVQTHSGRKRRALPDSNQRPVDLQSTATTTELNALLNLSRSLLLLMTYKL
jgi:hypothetical protein